jgi:hypothetical protein
MCAAKEGLEVTLSFRFCRHSEEAGLWFRESLIVESGNRRHLRVRFGTKAHPAAEALTGDFRPTSKSGSGIRIRRMPARSSTFPLTVVKWQLSEHLFHSPAGRRLWITPKIFSPYGATIRSVLPESRGHFGSRNALLTVFTARKSWIESYRITQHSRFADPCAPALPSSPPSSAA